VKKPLALEKPACLAVARAVLMGMRAANLKNNTSAARNHHQQFMKRFLLGLIAVAAVLLPLSQNAQAHWGYYHHYGYRHAYWHRAWHGGYWYGSFWHPGYWYGGPVVVVAPY
jgi:hypothetical protein